MRISKVSLFFFMLIFNYIFIRAILCPMIYDSYGVGGLFYTLMIFGGIVLFFLFLPKRFYEQDFFSKYRNSKIKYVVNGILLLRVVLGITLGVYILYELFFYDYSFWYLLFGVILVLFIICSLKPSEIIQISTFFGIVTIACYGLYLYNFIHLDFSLLKREFQWKFEWWLIISFLCMIFDNLYCLLSDKDKLVLSKKSILSSILATLALFLFEYSILGLSSGGKLFQGDDLIGFVALSIEPVSRYNGNFDYIYILMIGVACIFKFSYFFSILDNSMKWNLTIKKKIFAFILILVLSISSYWLMKMSLPSVRFIAIGLFLVGGVLFAWMIKEVYHAKQAKE